MRAALVLARSRSARASARGRQEGLGLVEVMISVVLSMLLAIALFTVLHVTLTGATSDRGLSALQGAQRQAGMIVQEIAQQAGYFVVNRGASVSTVLLTPANALPAAPPFGVAGQYVAGTTSPSGQDTMDVRFESALSNNPYEPPTIDCLGASALTTTPVVYENSFFVDPAAKSLDCSVNGGPATQLVGGGGPGGIQVDSMTVLYGVDTNATGSVTEYFPAAAVPNWTRVLSAEITLTFANPLYDGTGTNGQPATVSSTYTVSFLGGGNGA